MRPDDPSLTRTDWSMICDAVADGDGPTSREAMEHLARCYWPAAYAFIRSTGRDVHEASDLTQGFVCDVMLGRRLFEIADPSRGRFRSLLLQALQNYLRERHRNEQSVARGGSHKIVPMDPGELAAADSIQRSPDEAFAIQWSATLIRRVLELVRRGCLADGIEPHWTVFEQRVARPMLMGEQPSPYADLVRRLELTDASQAANMMVTVKRRFARALFAEVGRTVRDPDEAEAELSELLQNLPLLNDIGHVGGANMAREDMS